MTSAFMSDAAAQSAYGFGQGRTFSALFGKASVESILFHVFAVCAYAVERLTETHMAEVAATVAALRPHTLAWYQQKALAFRYGEPIDDATADYAADETPDTEKPVSQCAVVEADDGGLIIKVATTDQNGDLTYLPQDRLTAFRSYIGRVKDAGVKTTVTSMAGDRLTLKMTVYVDGTVFTADGELISEPVRPVEQAVKQYLTRLPFNGELILEHLTDYLQTVGGVEVPHVSEASCAAVSADGQDAGGYEAPAPIDVRHTPQSGYFAVSFDPEDSWASTIEYRFKP